MNMTVFQNETKKLLTQSGEKLIEIEASRDKWIIRFDQTEEMERNFPNDVTFRINIQCQSNLISSN
jgi:hypothetical protein